MNRYELAKLIYKQELAEIALPQRDHCQLEFTEINSQETTESLLILYSDNLKLAITVVVLNAFLYICRGSPTNLTIFQ